MKDRKVRTSILQMGFASKVASSVNQGRIEYSAPPMRSIEVGFLVCRSPLIVLIIDLVSEKGAKSINEKFFSFLLTFDGLIITNIVRHIPLL